ncbi:MAG: phosphoglucosamine mutase, partial [Hellea sp.]|nr:phosphoglucosamine mutase [Hellea sp.]
FFGTDGIRGPANIGILTPDNIMRFGMAAGKYFLRATSHKHSVIIGKDTRLSGYMIEPALVAGFASVGMDVKLTGPIPTPGVALMTTRLRADLGVMITASHNGFSDNGIKLFGPDGRKLSDEAELEIEALMAEGWKEGLAINKDLGRVRRYEDFQARYIEIAKRTFPKGMSLKGMKIVIDCANGAGYKTAPDTLWELGADEVIPIGVSPNGSNINYKCGSTHTDAVISKTLETGADIGIALDGDADRVLICDEKGKLIDGDQLLALIAKGWKDSDDLANGGVVATVMSNLGLENYIKNQGLDFIRTNVGDRHVAARMYEGGYNLGGEQSGHILMTDFASTGDGTIAALQILAQIIRAGRPASEVLNVFDAVPQALKNIPYSNTSPLQNPEVLSAIKDVQETLGNSGRVLVRPSGTEKLIRVMVESNDEAKVNKIVDDLATLIQINSD